MAVAVFALPTARRHYRGEERWFPLLDELGHRRLRAAFIAAGIPAARAGALVFFLDDQRHLDRHQAEATRTRYRALLAELDPAVVRRRARGGRSSAA